jgi:hypothetical protein
LVTVVTDRTIATALVSGAMRTPPTGSFTLGPLVLWQWVRAAWGAEVTAADAMARPTRAGGPGETNCAQGRIEHWPAAT